jgi:hypothetical protein
MPNIAHTLVRLRRFGVPAPRLVAVGATATDVFVVMAARHATPLEIALRAASAEKRRRWRERAEAFLRLLEDAGYCLADAGAWWRHLHLCAETDDIYLANASALKRCDAAPRKEKASAA